jgi:hypothetical protein
MKIWDTPYSDSRNCQAYLAYKGHDFKKWLENPLAKSMPWLILSPKYGYIEPTEMISDYKVTYDDDETRPRTISELRTQVIQEKRFGRSMNSWKKIYVVWNEKRDLFNRVVDSFSGLGPDVDYYFSSDIPDSPETKISIQPKIIHSTKILIDGSNVARFGNSGETGRFGNILLILNELERLGYNDYLIFCDANLIYLLDDKTTFRKMREKEQIIDVPANTPADFWILKYAKQFEDKGVPVKIVTKDKFKEWKEEEDWVKNNYKRLRVPFTIVEGKVQLYNLRPRFS